LFKVSDRKSNGDLWVCECVFWSGGSAREGVVACSFVGLVEICSTNESYRLVGARCG
jgi:hypothetical protein